MKNKKYTVKSTPIVPSLCGIGLAVLWYLFFYVTEGVWTFDFNTFSFAQMSGEQLAYTILTLLVPVSLFFMVLFLAEVDLRWMTGTMLFPIAVQMFLFVYYLVQDSPEYLFENPINFVTPFLALILFLLTVEKIIPTKWIFVGFCGLAVLLPLILTLFGIGEFTVVQEGYNANYEIVTYTTYLWSDYLTFALYYVGFGALAWQMQPATESVLVVEESSEEAEASEDAEVTEEDEEEDEDFDEDSDDDLDEDFEEEERE